MQGSNAAAAPPWLAALSTRPTREAQSLEQTRHGVGEGRAIRRPHYPTVRPERQQRIGLLGDRPQAPAFPGVANPPTRGKPSAGKYLVSQ
eukprot:scaffold63827_cov54-Phaeocystis_antarctica.AAC.1